MYKYVLRNDVLVDDKPHIQWQSHKIIISEYDIIILSY
jgi:hypothetical protein